MIHPSLENHLFILFLQTDFVVVHGLIVVTQVVALIVFVKVVPVWSSLVGVVSFVAGCVVTWRVKILYDKYIKGK